MKKLLFFLTFFFLFSCKKEYIVNFDLDGGNITNDNIDVKDKKFSIKVEKNKTIFEKVGDLNPTKDNYDFIGWYQDDELFNLKNNKITKNINLKAKWQKNLNGYLNDALNYKYEDYNYVSKYDLENGIIKVSYDKEDIDNKNMLNDLARFLGALYRVNPDLKSITYNNDIYTWNDDLNLKGSNWTKDDKTLVSVITEDYVNNPFNTLNFQIKDKDNNSKEININIAINE